MANSNVDGGTPSDLSAGGQTRKSDMRAAINAILYLLRAECPWRYLPRDRFPPRSTVYNIFRKFQRDGVGEAIWAELHTVLRSGWAGRPAPRRRSAKDGLRDLRRNGRQRQERAEERTRSRVRSSTLSGPSADL